MTPRTSAVAFALSSLLASSIGNARDFAHLAVSTGVFDVTEQKAVSAEGSLQYYSGYRLFAHRFLSGFKGFGPMLGLMANSDGAVFGYGAAYTPIALSERVELLPSAGLGGYAQGHSKDLGGVFEFHLGVGLFYQLSDHTGLPRGTLVGVTYAHISNAFIHSRNPGANSLLGSISVPLAVRF